MSLLYIFNSCILFLLSLKWYGPFPVKRNSKKNCGWSQWLWWYSSFSFTGLWDFLISYGFELFSAFWGFAHSCAVCTKYPCKVNFIRCSKKSATIQVEHDFRSEVFKFQKPRDSHSKVLFQKLNLLFYLKGLTWRQRGPHMLYKYFFCWLILQ